MSGDIDSRAPARCLYLAPMKSPHHPVPSGDRTIARQFLGLLAQLGVSPDIASELRTWCREPADLARVLAEAERERHAILERERALPEARRARFVFTYHNYYKAPDILGPSLAAGLGIPYLIAESSRSPRRADGPWHQGHALAEAASDAAAVIFTPTSQDARMLEALKPSHQQVVRLPPFLDPAEWPEAALPRPEKGGTSLRLITVAMMRPGAKLASYSRLAAALAGVKRENWHLDIIGDGEERAQVEALFARFGDKVRFAGAIVGRRALGAQYRQADLLIWPGVDEAIGMIYLEAQLHGLPCLACDFGGVRDVVAHGITGHVVDPADPDALTAQLEDWLAHPAPCRTMGLAASQRVTALHSIASARNTCAEALRGIGITLPPLGEPG